MNRKLRSVIILVLVACLVYGGSQLAIQMRSHQQAKASVEAALAAAQKVQVVEDLPEEPVPLEPAPTVELSPPEPVEKEPVEEAPVEEEPQVQPPAEAEPADAPVVDLMALDLEALRQTNPDVLGWITIPDTVISYPLMKAEDNQEYLYQTWDGKYSKYGSIFLECRNSHDLSDFNTLIYGHNMRTDEMFGTLLDYGEQRYFESHPSIYIVTDAGVRRYDVFSAYEAKVVSDTYRLIFEDDARRQTALELYTGSSVLDTGIVPEVDDAILTLSTCTGRGTADLRFVVQAVLAEEIARGE